MSNLKQIYSRAERALIARLSKQDPALAAAVQSGTARVRPAMYYIRRKLQVSVSKYFQDFQTSRTAGITNFEKGKFPYKMTAAFSHIDISYGYSAADVAANAVKYHNTLYDASKTAEQVIGANSYPVESELIDTDFLNAEATISVGDEVLFDRTPVSSFFKKARYQTDDALKGGILSLENCIELPEVVTCTDSNSVEFEITWPAAAAVTDYTYVQFALMGLEVAVK